MHIVRARGVAAAVLLAGTPAAAQGKLNVVTTTEDLAAIAREVGGDRITVESIAKGYQDPHFVEAKPSFILKLQKADLLIVRRPGARDRLAAAADSAEPQRQDPGRRGRAISTRRSARRSWRFPTGQITRAMGDVHPLGNPHYWLDPENGKRIAKEIADKFSRAAAERPRLLRAAAQPTSTTRLDDAEKRWMAQMAPYKGTKVVTYHRSFPNFAERFRSRHRWATSSRGPASRRRRSTRST